MKKIILQFCTFIACIAFGANSKGQATSIDPSITTFEHQLANNQKLLINQLFIDTYYQMDPALILSETFQKSMIELDSLKTRYTKADEIKVLDYYYANKWATFTEIIRNKFSRDEVWYRIAAQVLLPLALPERNFAEKSMQARIFLRNLSRFQLQVFSIQVEEEGMTIVPQRLGKSLEEIRSFVSNYGEISMSLLFAEKNLPPHLFSFYLKDQIELATKQENRALVAYLAEKIQSQFPDEADTKESLVMVQAYQHRFNQNSQNPKIHLIENPDRILTLEQLIAPFKGKLIYLDFWGSWCGPCLNEMRSESLKTIKQEFSGQEVIWIYLALENPQSVPQWESTIYYHGIEGYHLHKSMESIEPFWQAIFQDKDVPRAYPTYVLIGREGQILNKKAPRPSAQEELRSLLQQHLPHK
jgi:thiol-disulfide isomerase/thioredoxin